MIEINLLPGSVKRTKRKMGGGGLPLGPLAKIKLPAMDKILLMAIGMWVAGVLLIVWMQISSSSALKAAKLEEAALQRDTAAASKQISQNALLVAKRDTIAQKLTVIQELDAGRFNWAHIFDEIGRALPDYMWLVAINPSADNSAAKPAFKIEGRMANAFALPKFMQDLEASPFISNVTLINSGPVVENQKSLYTFTVEADYEEPSADLIHTEPLFGPDMQPDSATADRMGISPEPKARADSAGKAAPAAKPGAPGTKPASGVKPPPAKKSGKE